MPGENVISLLHGHAHRIRKYDRIKMLLNSTTKDSDDALRIKVVKCGHDFINPGAFLAH